MAFPVTSPGALLPLDAPLPQPRRYTLLDAANLITPEEDRWLAGAWVNGYPAGRPFTHDPCSSGTFRLKAAEPTDARPMAGSFTVVVGGTCTARSIGSDLSWYEDRLGLWFRAVESEAVERSFITGDGEPTIGAYVGDADISILNGGTAVSPREGMALLEDAIAAVGNGIIHVAPATATYMQSYLEIATARDNQLRTGLGTLLVVGTGYRNTAPDGHADPTGKQEWAYATGFVDVRRDPVPTILSTEYTQVLDRATNEVTMFAERNYLVTWVGRQATDDANHIQAGVLIDRSLTP